MNKHTAFAGIALVAVVVLTGCASEDLEITEATAAAVTTIDGASGITSSTAASSTSTTTSTTSAPASSSATSGTTSSAPAAATTSTAAAKVPTSTSAPKKTTTTTAPRTTVTSGTTAPTTTPAPATTTAPTSNGFPNPAPVTPASITPGKTYPWFPVAPGKLAQPYGVTGELLYADAFVTVIRSGPQEIVVASDNYSLRGAWKVTGVTDAKVTVNNGRTLVRLSCNGTELGGTSVRHYNTATINPASLSVTYDAGMNVSEFDCQNS